MTPEFTTDEEIVNRLDGMLTPDPTNEERKRNDDLASAIWAIEQMGKLGAPVHLRYNPRQKTWVCNAFNTGFKDNDIVIAVAKCAQFVLKVKSEKNGNSN